MHSHFVFLLLLFSAHLTAQTPVIMGHNQKFIHQDDANGLILIESLNPGMTLYSLSRKYNVTIDLILATNPDLSPNAIPLGYPVNIPVDKRSISFVQPPENEERIWLSYRVQPKETLYRISKVYFNTDPEVITALNHTSSQSLAIGQVLHVGWLKPIENNSNQPMLPIGADSTKFIPKDFIKEAYTEGKVIRHQKGLAVWKPGKVSSNYYVLHPTAKLGSFMEITNPMLHRTITAKVAGHIPPGLYQSHVGIVVSPSTARALGILDQQFFASWRYVE